MRAIRALMLVLALSVCAYADGIMPNGRDGIMPNGKAETMPNDKADTIDPVTEIALQLLQSVLPLF